MTITGIKKCKGNIIHGDYVTFMLDNVAHSLSVDLNNTLIFECMLNSEEENSWDYTTLRKLIIYCEDNQCSNLTFDDFTLAHMTNSMNVSMKDLDVIWLMYCCMFDENKTEQSFRLELEDLLGDK